MAENKELDQPLRSLASDCNELFEEIVNASFANQQELFSQTVEYRDAFAALTTFLCIFNEPDSCLDYRLRRYESLQDIMIRLLELLRQNLFTVFVFITKTESDRSPSVASEVAVALQGIKDSLKSLNKFAITIRESSRSSALTLARNFATSKRDLEDFEELILISLEILYPNALESLREHICNTLTDRYARLEYSAYMRGANRPMPSKQCQDEAITPPNETQPVRWTSITRRSETIEFDHVEKMIQDENKDVQQQPLSSLDTGHLRQNFNNEHIKRSQSKRTVSVYESDGRLHEPQLPKFEAGEAEVQCRWCDELLNRSAVWNNSWSNIGRRHYKRDLKPFPCLSGLCGESRPSYSSRKDWLAHMRLKHSTAWPQSLYSDMLWVCHDHHEDSESIPYAFSSQDALKQHMLLIHSREWLSDDEFTQYREHWPSVTGTMMTSTCPLCFFVAENSDGVEETSPSQPRVPTERVESVNNNKKDERRVQSGVSFAPDVKAACDVNDADKVNAGDDIDNKPSTTFALELHIAAHLQYLLVMSLRLMETLRHDGEEDGLIDSRGSNDPATGFASSMNDGLELERWSDEELASVYMSDSERVQLKHMRTEREAAEDVLPSYEQDQWADLNVLVEGPTEEDSTLQDFCSKQKSHSRIEYCRMSVQNLRLESYSTSAEGYRWRDIGLLQAEIFSESKQVDDLDQAIEAFQNAAKKSSSDPSVVWQNLADLSFHLFEKYKMEPHGLDLDTALEITQNIIEMDDGTHQLLDHLYHLSSLLRGRYSKTGIVDDLTRAVEIARQGLGLVPEDSGKQARCHNHLGNLLTLVYWRTGIETTLDEAIKELRLAVNFATEEEAEYSDYLAALSEAVDMKFAISGSQVELHEAIQLMRESLTLMTECDLAFLGRRDSLGSMLGELYTMTGAIETLQESIRVGRTVISSTPAGDMHAADRMAHLSDRLADSFENTNDMKTLEEALHLSEAAVEITPRDHPRFHVYCHSLATKSFKRWTLGPREAKKLRFIISLSEKAIESLPDTDVNTAMYICLLADAKQALHICLLADAKQALMYEPYRLYETAISHVYSALQYRLEAGRKLFKAHVEIGNWYGGYKAAKMTIGCLEYLPFSELPHLDKLRILETIAWITSEGIAAALNASRPPFEVLSLLEDSRCLDANSSVYCQEAFERLRQAHPSKLDELLAIRKNLTRPIFVSPSGFDNSPWNARSKRHYQAIIDCERVLTEVRSKSGFSDWLNREDETRTLHAGSKGPVVVLTASELRSDAIIIQRDTIEVVSLPDLDYDKLQGPGWRRFLPVESSLWIWKTIAQPVLAHLDLSPAPPRNYPRLWLIPTGLLTNLPIHAAGDYRELTSESMSMLDYAVCSYSPSIKALVLAHDTTAIVADNATALLVNIEDNPGHRKLQFSVEEISNLEEICQTRGLDVYQPNHKEAALQALVSCTLFHFASIFVCSNEDPLKSYLLLEDGSITMKDMLNAISRLYPPFLAYLSGCDTAKTLQRDFANECLHAVGALHMGGFRHAIGTLGLVSDEFCYEFSKLFYKAWSSKGLSDDTVALCLHDATRTCRNRWKEEGLGNQRDLTKEAGRLAGKYDADKSFSMEWARFIHWGP